MIRLEDEITIKKIIELYKECEFEKSIYSEEAPDLQYFMNYLEERFKV